MKKHIHLIGIILLSALLSGFFWKDVTWESINAEIDRKYPNIISISTDDFKKILDKGHPPVIIDVRAREEFEISHLPGALHIQDFQEIQLSRNTPVVAYCSVGIRSAKFLKRLQKKGYKQINNLRGSIFEWANKGYPLMRNMKPVFTVHPYNQRWGRLLKPEKHQYELGAP